jgi:hypothetical protein
VRSLGAALVCSMLSRGWKGTVTRFLRSSAPLFTADLLQENHFKTRQDHDVPVVNPFLPRDKYFTTRHCKEVTAPRCKGSKRRRACVVISR